jgi:cyclophilin family peptidyl-prolyl cis-trans isomerase
MARQQTKKRRKRYQPGSAYAGDVRPTGVLGIIGGSGTMKAVFFVMALALAGGGLYGIFNTGVFGNNQDNLAGFNVPDDLQPTGTPSGEPTPAGKQYAVAPSMTIDTTKTYTATITTELGDIQVQLDAAAAPQTVNNFVFLARDGFYDGLTFHYVSQGFSAQAGDPTGQGSGGPGYELPHEASGDFDAGTVGMANGTTPGQNSGSQFFIALTASDQFDTFTPFGRVVSGLDVAEQLAIGTTIESVQITEG